MASLIRGHKASQVPLDFCGGGRTNPTQPPRPRLDELKEGLLKLRKPMELAVDRNDWKKACELYLEKINWGEQMLCFARRDGSQVDIRNCERGVELYRETYSQLVAEANHPTRPAAWRAPSFVRFPLIFPGSNQSHHVLTRSTMERAGTALA